MAEKAGLRNADWRCVMVLGLAVTVALGVWHVLSLASVQDPELAFWGTVLCWGAAASSLSFLLWSCLLLFPSRSAPDW